MPSPRSLAEAAVEGIARFRWLVIGLVVLALGGVVVAWGQAVEWDASKQPVDNGIEIWFLEGDPALIRYRAFHEAFDNDEVIIIGFKAEEGILTPANLDLVAEVSDRLKAMLEVESVTSLATVIWSGTEPDDAETIVAKRLYEAPVKDTAAASEVGERLAGMPALRDDLLAEDGKTTLITARLEVLDDIDARRGEILETMELELRAAFKAAGRDEREWAWAGLAVGNEAMNQVVQRDINLYSALSLLVIIVRLWLSLRRVIPVIVAIVAVEAAVFLLIGVYLGTGYKLNLVSMILPSLVMVIGLTDSVYFLTTYYQDRERLEKEEGLTKRQAIVKSLGFCVLPGLFNSITASVGFLAFMTAKMAVVRQFGVFAGVGILLAFLCSVVFCTLGCELFDIRPKSQEDSAGGAWTRAALEWISDFVARRHRAIVVGALVVFCVAMFGVLQIRVDSDPLNYFYDDHPVQKDAKLIESSFGPAAPLEFVVDTGRDGGAQDPAVLQGIAKLQQSTVEREELVGNAVSLTSVVERLTELIDGEARIPDDPYQIAQELELFYDPRKNDDPLHLVDWPGYSQARITFRIGKTSSLGVEELSARIEEEGAKLLPEGTEIQAAGYVPLYVRLMDYLIEGQVSSLATTFVVIFVVIAILFRSLRYALISIPPNVIPVAMTLGFMGYAGINLDGATVLIASISLGVAVDDTIHFIFKFRDVYERTGDDGIAVAKTLKTTGVAIATTSIVIALGFSVIALGGLKSMAYFGLLTAVTMFSALAGELLVTPAVILTFAPRRKAEPAAGEVEPASESPPEA